LTESGIVSGEQLPVVYDYLLVRTLAEAVLRDRPELDRFAGSVHEMRRAQFAQLDERFIALTRQVVAQRANAVPAVRGGDDVHRVREAAHAELELVHFHGFGHAGDSRSVMRYPAAGKNSSAGRKRPLNAPGRKACAFR